MVVKTEDFYLLHCFVIWQSMKNTIAVYKFLICDWVATSIKEKFILLMDSYTI